jgi:hypothetical protein
MSGNKQALVFMEGAIRRLVDAVDDLEARVVKLERSLASRDASVSSEHFSATRD